MNQKLTRSAIKSIVKECLIEILEEGISEKGSSRLSESSRRKTKTKHKDPPVRRKGFDNVSYSRDSRKPNSEFESNIARVANSMTSDPVLSSILADTAKTTLQEQVAGERVGPAGVSMPTAMAGDAASRQAAQSSPEDLFAGSASKWADLAFASPVNKR
mgnify:CR=1 FL=1